MRRGVDALELEEALGLDFVHGGARRVGSAARVGDAAVREHGMTYSVFIAGLNKAEIDIDRKVLADLAVHDKIAFTKIAEQAKASLA